MKINKHSLLTLLLFAVGVSSCAARQWETKYFQFCLTKQKDVNFLKNVMKEIAKSERLDYVDHSDKQYDFLIGAKDPTLKETLASAPREKFIHTLVLSPDESLRIDADNYPRTDDQVILVVSGSDTNLSKALAVKVEAVLSREWQIHIPPANGPNYALNCKLPFPH